MLVIRGAEAAYALKTRQQSKVPSLRTGDVDLPRQSQFRDNRAATSNVVRSKDRKRQWEGGGQIDLASRFVHFQALE